MIRNSSNSAAPMSESARNFATGSDGTAGAALIEFTIFAPMLVGLIIGLLDFGLSLYRSSHVTNAAHARVLYAVQRGTFDASSITSAVQNAMCYPANSCGGFTSTITASPTPAKFCGCPSSSGVTQIGNGTCNGTILCADGSVPGNYVTVQA